MRSGLGTLVVLLVVAASWAGGPEGAVAAAAADLARQPEALRHKLRYLTTYAMREKEKEDFAKAQAFWVNSLSREAEPARPALVADDLYRIVLDDYGWKRETYEKLADADPYFHVKLKEEGRTVRDRRGHVQRTAARVRTATAPWLPAREMAFLVNETNSRAPVLRADWFLVRTSIQTGRNGDGYFDFLGLADRGDFEQLIGFSKELSVKARREIRGIVKESQVAINNRQIVRFQSVTGGYWITLDVTSNVGKANAIRNLDKDYVHEFEEHYGFNPVGLFVFYLSNAAGVQANTAPDTVASDRGGPTPDTKVYAGKSCVSCHVDGLRSIDDVGRATFTPPVGLQSADYAKFLRLRQLYIADLQYWLVKDRTDYAYALAKVNGLKPEQNAKVFREAWDNHQNRALTGEDVAREMGPKLADIQRSLRAQAQALRVPDFDDIRRGKAPAGAGDPVLAALLHDKPLTIRREHWEEAFPLIQTVMREYP